ncbi:MAG TPA: two-component regulator propeller domain-containing protein, partial [Dongiaceae bacterium]|nr:two-component regulator propeller domain-containing protein [Dongiaceae bacterium]
LWTGTAEGLRRWEQGAWKEVGQEELGPRAVSFIDEDGASNLWVSVGPGKLYRRDHGHWSLIDLGDHFAPAPATCMEEDREGSIWLGTEQGLIQVQPRRVRAYTTRDGLAGDNVWSVCEGTDGAIWVGTDQGLSRIQNGRVVPLGVDEPLLPYADRCVWPAGEGGVFVAKSGLGILKYRNRFSQWVEAKNLPGPNTAGLYEDRSGHLWTGTESGVAVFEGGQATACYTNWAGRAGYDVRCILEDRSGTFWFGTQGQGLTRLHQGKFGVFTTRDGLSNDRVWSIHEDAEGALWLGTENGLTRYWKGRFFALTRRHGLLENSVNWILEDDWGHLWLSGLRGIYRVKREQLNAVADGRAATVECAAFGTADGMESSETNGENQPAGWKARDGRLWFPTTRGVVVIDPKAIQTNEVPTLPVIEQVKADGEVIFGDGRSNQLAASASPVRLAPGRARVVEFRYTANTFAAPSRARFRYRLAGHEAAWREETPERVAHYTGLLPGGYRFEVTAANQCGVWKAASAVFAFSLAPKFSQTPWFPLSWALALLIGSSALVGWRLRWQRRALQAEQMAAVERERTRIARDLHDDLGASLTGMALELEAAHRRGQAGGGQLATLADEARSLALGVRELAWTTNPRCDNVGSLGVFLGELTERFCAAAGLECKLDLPPADDPRVVPARVRHDLLVVVKESLANATRHARAQSISLQLTASAGQLRLTVRDDGAGLDPARAASGSGLRNLRERMDHAGGTFAVSSAPAGGTTITAMVPLSEPEEN